MRTMIKNSPFHELEQTQEKATEFAGVIGVSGGWLDRFKRTRKSRVRGRLN